MVKFLLYLTLLYQPAESDCGAAMHEARVVSVCAYPDDYWPTVAETTNCAWLRYYWRLKRGGS